MRISAGGRGTLTTGTTVFLGANEAVKTGATGLEVPEKLLTT